MGCLRSGSEARETEVPLVGMELLIRWLRRDVGSQGQHSSGISKRRVGGAQGWSVAWTEPKTSEGLVSLFGI